MGDFNEQFHVTTKTPMLKRQEPKINFPKASLPGLEPKEAGVQTLKGGDFAQPQEVKQPTQSQSQSWASPYVEEQEKAEAVKARNLDRYQINLPDEDYAILNDAIANAEIPEDEAYRWATALQYSKMYDLNLGEAYQEIENLNYDLYGDKAFTPKTNFVAVTDALAMGVNTLKRNQLGIDLKAAYETNNEDEINFLKAEIASINADTMSLADNQPRKWGVEALKFAAQSAPFTGYSILAGVLGSVVAPGVGTIASFAVSSSNMAGGEYLDLLDEGVSHELASGLSLVSGSLQGIVEVALGVTAGALSKATGVSTITNNLFKRLHVTKAWARAAKVLGQYAGEVNEEGIEEVIQSLISDGTKALALELEKDGVESGYAEEVARNAWESYKGGIMGALVLGLPGGAISAKTEFSDAKSLKTKAQAIDSKEAFIRETEESPVFKGLTKDARVEAQSQVWEQNTKKREELVKSETSDIASWIDGEEEAGASDIDGETEGKQSAPVQRDQDRLYTQFAEKNRDITGRESGEFIVGNPLEETSNNDYGHIYYTVDEEASTVRIDDLRMRGSEHRSIIKEFVSDFTEKFPGKEIEWDPKGKTLQAIKAELIAENPRGKSFGLQAFESETDIGNTRGRLKLDSQIKSFLPKLDANERAAAVAILEARSDAKGIDLQTYLDSSFKNEIFSNEKQEDFALASSTQTAGIKGGIEFKSDISGSAKALIYVTEKSDFSTYVHEVAHVFRRDMDGELLAMAEEAFGVQDNNWTRELEEKFAIGFEEYLREGKAPTSQLESLFSKAKEFLRKIYQSLANRVEVSPQIREVYDALFTNKDTKAKTEQSFAGDVKTDAMDTQGTTVDPKIDGNKINRDETGSLLTEIGDLATETSTEIRDADTKPSDSVVEEAGEVETSAPAQENEYVEYKEKIENAFDTAGALKAAGEKYKNIPDDLFFQDETVKKLLEDMTKEELIETLHTSDSAASIPNYRAYLRDTKNGNAWPVQASLDADSLKWVNDNMGHSTGDLMLKEIGEKFKLAAKDFGVRMYHKSGDEFLVQAKTVNEYIKFKTDLDYLLKDVILIVRDEALGLNIEKPGIFISDGIDNKGDINAADRNLGSEKSYREAHGERAGRGNVPPGTRIVYDSGRISNDHQTKVYFKKRERDLKKRVKKETKNSKPVNQFTPQRTRELRQIIESGGDILFQLTTETGEILPNNLQDILFQTEQELVTDAASFDSWQLFMEFYEEGSWSRPDDAAVPLDVDEDWYRSFWEDSKKITKEESDVMREVEAEEKRAQSGLSSPNVKDALFSIEIAKPGVLESFLKEIYSITHFDHTYKPSDSAELANFENVLRLERRINVEMRHGYWMSQASRVSRGGKMTERVRKTLISIIENAKRDYRSLYADIMDNEEFAVDLADTTGEQIKTRLRSRKVNVDMLTPAQKMVIADEIKAEDIKTAIKRGELQMDEKVDFYLKNLEGKLRDGQREFEALQADIKEDERKISDHQVRDLLKMKDELELAKMRYERAAQGMKSNKIIHLTAKAFNSLKKYGREVEQKRTDYESIYKRMIAMKKTAEALGAVTGMLEKRDSLFRQESINGAIKREIAAVKEIRNAKSHVVKSVMRRVTFNSCNYEQGVKILAIQKAFGPSLKKGLNKWIGTEGPYLRDVYTRWQTDSRFRQELVEQIGNMPKASEVIKLLKNKPFDKWSNKERETALGILPKEDLYKELGLGIIEKRNDEDIQFDEKSEEFNELLKNTLPRETLARIKNRPFVEWTLEEMEELGILIDSLHKQGREAFRAEQIAKKKDAARARAQIIKALGNTRFNKNIRGPLAGSVEQKKEAGSFKHRMNSIELATMRRMEVATRLDGGRKGFNYDKLVFEERECFADRETKKLERNAKMNEFLKESPGLFEDLFTTVEFDNFWQNETKTYTVDDILFMYAAEKDPLSKYAVRYGVLATEIEREDMGSLDEWDDLRGDYTGPLTKITDARYKRILNKAESLLEENPALLKLVETIADDYASQYQRMNEFMIKEFNKPVFRVEKYVPLYRTGTSAETNENRVLEDLTAESGRVQTGTSKGQTNKRLEISPAFQRPVELGLYNTWVKSVDSTEHLIAYGSYVRDLNRIYKSLDASGARDHITNAYGMETVRYVDDLINTIANPEAGKIMTDVDKMIRSLRGSTASGYLAWKMSGILKQFVTSPEPFFAYISPLEYTKAAFDLMTDKGKTQKMIAEQSAIMNSRTMDPVIDLIKRMQKDTVNPVASGIQKFNTLGMAGLEFADRSCVEPGWLALYRKKIRELTIENDTGPGLVETMKSTEEIEAEAVKYADDITILIQPSGRSVDLAPLFRQGKTGGGEALKILTQFQTSLNVIWNNLRYDMPNAVREGQTGVAVRMVASYVVAGIALGVLADGLNGGDDDEDEIQKARRFLFYATTQFSDSVPLIGNAVSGTLEKLITGKSNVFMSEDFFPAAGKVLQGAAHIGSGSWDKAALRFSEGIGYTFGLPVSGMKEAARFFGAGSKDGKMNPEALLGRRR